MILRTTTLTCLFLLTTAATGFSQVKLEHKFAEGSTIRAETLAVIDQTLTIAGNGTETNVESNSTTELTIGKRDADGKLPVEETVKSLQITIGGTAGEYRFDSANPDDAGGSPLEMMRGVHKAISQRTQTVIFDSNNRVVEIQFDEGALSQLPVEVQALAKSQLDPEYLKEVANQMLDIIPSRAVKSGDSWERDSKANFGAGQLMEFTTRYTYEGAVDKDGRQLDKITSKTLTVEFSLADDSPLPISLKDSDLKVKESRGVIYFDRELGRVVESKGLVRVAGGITFVASGQELPSELDLTMQTEIVSPR